MLLKSKMLEEADWIWSVAWLNYIHLPDPIFLLFCVAIATHVLAIIRPNFFIFRLLAGAGWLCFYSAVSSFGDFSHNEFGIFTVALLLIFESPKHPFRFFHIARAFCLSIYFNAAIWKVRGLIEITQGWEELTQQLPFHIARGVAEGNGGSMKIMEFLLNWPFLSGLAWISIILIQMASIVWLFCPRKDWIWGLFIIFFHMGSAFTLGIEFNRHIVLIVFMFMILPLFRDAEYYFRHEPSQKPTP